MSALDTGIVMIFIVTFSAIKISMAKKRQKLTKIYFYTSTLYSHCIILIRIKFLHLHHTYIDISFNHTSFYWQYSHYTILISHALCFY